MGPGGNNGTGPGSGDGRGTGGRGGSSGGSGGRGGATGGGRGNNTPGPRDGNGRGRTGAPSDGQSSGGFAADTPGPRDATDGRRGSSMGARGGLAGADGSTPASRARDAMSRHSREAARRDGIGKEYGLVAALQEKAIEGTMSPREADMAIGMATQRNAMGLTQSMSAPVGQVSGAIGRALGLAGLPGASSLGEAGLSAAADAGVPNNPESKYGAAHTKSRMSNSTAQNVGQVAAGLFGGAPGAAIAGGINAAANLNSTADIGRLGESMGVSSGKKGPSNTAGSGSSNGARGTPSAARAAMSAPSPAPKAQPFSWNPVDMTKYNRGLLSLAQSS